MMDVDKESKDEQPVLAVKQLGMVHLTKALDLVTRATEEDTRGNYEAAVKLYNDGVEYFLLFIKYEAQTDKVKDTARSKCTAYLERAVEIKEYLRGIHQKSEKASKYLEGCTDTENANGNNGDCADDTNVKKILSQLEDMIMFGQPYIPRFGVAGLEEAKEVLRKAVILPIKYPNLCTRRRIPWTRILLFGPPGSGKSFLANSIATEANNTTLLSVTSFHLVSRCYGGIEKSIQTLFAIARQQKPSVVFIDDLESLFSSSPDYDYETVRRLKTSLLAEVRGYRARNRGILLMGTTSVPWSLDADILRMFHKRIYIPLPDETARLSMFKRNIGNSPNCLSEDDFKTLAEITDGFSGKDITTIIWEALLQPIRKVQTSTNLKMVKGPSRSDPSIIVDDLLTPCPPGEQGAMEMSWVDVPGEKLLVPSVTMEDMLHSVSCARPTVNYQDLRRMTKFVDDSNWKDKCLVFVARCCYCRYDE